MDSATSKSGNFCRIAALLLILLSALRVHSQGVPNELNTGYPENSIFHGSEIENVQFQNGNLHVSIPIWSAKGRGLNTGLSFVYDNHGWKFKTVCYTSGGGFCQDTVIADPLSSMTLTARGPLDYGFTPNVGGQQQCGLPMSFVYFNSGYFLREPDGTKHHFAPDPAAQSANACGIPFVSTLYADDGSGWALEIDPPSGNVAFATSKSGTRIVPGNGVANSAQSVTDANENQLTQTSTSATDTLGRVIPAPGSYYDSSGTLQSLAVTPTQLTLPNNQGTYIFTYAPTIPTQLCQFSHADQCSESNNGGGEITSITLPTGGQISYTWGPWGAGGRRVASRTVSANGVTGTWQYQYAPITFDSSSWVIVTDPSLKDMKYSVEPGICTPQTGGYTCEVVKYFDGAAATSTLIKTVQTDYTFLSAHLGNSQIKLPIRVTTTWNQQNLATKVETDWDVATVPAGSSTWSNPVERREYDWGTAAPGPLLRRTDYSYRHLESDGQSYLNANIADLPTVVQTYDSAGNLRAQTNNYYDGSSLTATGSCGGSGAPGHNYCSFGTPGLVRGNVTQVSHWLNTTNTWLNTTHTYDDLGNLLSTTDPLQNQTTIAYDDNWADSKCVGSANTHAFPTLVKNALGHRTKTSYYSCTSLVQSKKDENDLVAGRNGTTFAYDLLNRPLVTAYPDGGQTSFSYNDTVPMTITKTTKATPDPDIVSSVQLDDLGRTGQTHLVDPEGDVYTKVVYDAFGRKQNVYNPTRCNPPDTNCGTEPTWGVTSYAYDALSRVTQTTKQDGSFSTAAYERSAVPSTTTNCTLTTDEAGKQRKTCSDALGRLTEVHEPNPSSPPSAAVGSLSINGTLLSQSGVGAYGASYATAQLNINGVNHYLPGGGKFGDPPYYDSGKVYITVNGHEYDYWFGGGGYGPPDYTTSVAQGLVNAIQADGARLVNASVPSGSNTITLTAVNAGSAGNSIAFSTGYTWDTSTWSTPSFTASPGSGPLTGGNDAYPGVTVFDKGTVTLTTSNGGSATACYGRSTDCAAPPPGCPTGDSTPSQVACVLAAGLNSGSAVSAVQNGASLTITDKTPGPIGNNVTATATGQSTQTQWTFSQSSFCPPPGCSATLSGGVDSVDVANNYVTLYSYDVLGNLLSVTQKGGATDPTQWRVRTFTYDSLSHLLTAQNPESGTITYSYDADGNVIQKISPQANQTGSATTTVSYCYDPLNRIDAKEYTNSPATPPQCAATPPYLPNTAVTYSYDSGTNAVGHLSSLTDPAGSASYTYDVMGRLAGESRTIAGVAKSMSYSYNLAGSLDTLTNPSGAIITYAPDSAGHDVSAIDKANGINYATGATYGPDGALTGFVSGKTGSFAGLSNVFSYNNRLQPVLMSAATTSQTVFSIGYDFRLSNGDNGNVYALTNNRDHSRDQTFTYDALNRLTSAQNAGTDCSQKTPNPNQTKFWGNNYGYDAWGNLLSKSVTKCSAENLSLTAAANNQLQGGYTYDAAGNMTHDATSSLNYSYDQENRITSAAGFTYTYDADSNRVAKSNGSTGTLYWYMTPGIVAESDLPGNLTSEYVFFDGERAARKDFPSNAVFYYFSDHLKTASVITDDAGNIKSDSDYYPWGGELVEELGGSALPVLNPGFETGAASGWNLGYWGASSTITNVQAHSGTYSLVQSGSTTGGSFQDISGLTTGVTYQVSVWVRADAGTTAQMYLWVHDTTGANAANTAAMTPRTIWQQVLLTYIADSTGQIRIHLHYIAGTGTIYYDDVQLVPLNVPSNFANHYKFTGKERDSETNLDYFGARYYSNGLGRFVTPDWATKATAVPFADVADPQSLNLYSYVRNIPTTRFDADGHVGDDDKKSVFDAFISGVNDFIHYAVHDYQPNVPGVPSPGSCVPGNQNNNKQSNSNSKQQSSTENQSGQGKSTRAGNGKETGSYTNTHASGKTYSGKGSRARSQASGQRVEKQTGDKHTATDWRPSANDREAFKDESHRIDANGGANSSSNHNQIESPGKTYRKQDGSK